MLGTAAELDFMMQDAGVDVVFSRGASTIACTFGLLDSKQLLAQGDAGYQVAGHDITLVVRDGTQGAIDIDDVATIDTVTYRVRDLGMRLSDGTRVITLAG